MNDYIVTWNADQFGTIDQTRVIDAFAVRTIAAAREYFDDHRDVYLGEQGSGFIRLHKCDKRQYVR